MRGFSLIEIIIVLSLLIAIAAVGLPYYSAWQQGLWRQETVAEIGQWLRTVQARADSGWQQNAHGLKLEPELDRMVVYRGDNFAGRDQGSQQEIGIKSNIGFIYNNLSSDLNFGYLSVGNYPEGRIDITQAGETIGQIAVNRAGIIQWQIY